MNGQHENREREIAERARRLFADTVQRVDGQTRSKLAQARLKAIEAASVRRRRWWPAPAATLVPLGGVLAAALAVAVIWQNPGAPTGSMEPAVLSDLEMLLEGEDLGLLEDLDFYAWLLLQPELLDGMETPDGSG
jgi:hypothetical protein